MERPVFRASAGCEYGCPLCNVTCFMLAVARDQRCRELEDLRLLQSRQPSLDQQSRLQRLEVTSADASQAHEQVRPRSSGETPSIDPGRPLLVHLPKVMRRAAGPIAKRASRAAGARSLRDRRFRQ